MLITIGAMIGAGKTSLATLVAEHFNSEVFFESVDDNPILPLFYTSTEEEILQKIDSSISTDNYFILLNLSLKKWFGKAV